MIIRTIEAGEVKRLVDLGAEFYAESGLPGSFIPDVFTAFWTRFIESNVGEIFVIEERGHFLGTLGALYANDPNDGALVANEFFWYVTKEARKNGLRLLDAYEESARARGAKRMSMVHLSNLAPDTLKKLYLRRGYRELETHYMKGLS